jgi:hypothetical protein
MLMASPRLTAVIAVYTEPTGHLSYAPHDWAFSAKATKLWEDKRRRHETVLARLAAEGRNEHGQVRSKGLSPPLAKNAKPGTAPHPHPPKCVFLFCFLRGFPWSLR